MPITSLPGANLLPPEHKIGIFVRFWGLEPPFSGVSSTKSRFLCFLGIWSPRFRVFRAQNRGFCAFWGSGALIFEHFEHKIRVFVLFWPSRPLFSGVSSTKSRFLCFFALWNPHFLVFRAQNRGFCAQEEGKVGSENVTAKTLTTLPPHLRRRTSAPAPAHRQRPPSNGTRRCQVLSWRHVVLSLRRQVPSGAV